MRAVKIVIYLTLALAILTTLFHDEIHSQVTQIVNIAVEKARLKYVPVRDATRGDNPDSGLVGAGLYVYDGTNFKLMRGDSTSGIWANIKNLTVSNTLSDSYSNPTNALNTGSFLMGFDGTYWRRARLITSPADNATPSNILATENFNMLFDGTDWDRERSLWNNISCNNVGTIGSCTTINISSHPMTKHTWTVVWTGSPTDAQVNLEGSLDNTNWFVLDTSTTTTSEMRHVVNKGVLYYRANVVSVSGGTTPAVTVRIASFRD